MNNYKNFTVYLGGHGYDTVFIGGDLMAIKSDSQVSGPSIDDISLNAYTDRSTNLYVDVDNESDYEIDVQVTHLYIDTSSATYDEDDWENEGSLYTPIPANGSQESLLFFSDGCTLNSYEIDFEFFYNGVSLGVLHVEG